jgi:hypothetical protein
LGRKSGVSINHEVISWKIYASEDGDLKKIERSWGKCSSNRMTFSEERTIQELDDKLKVMKYKVTRVLSQKAKPG